MSACVQNMCTHYTHTHGVLNKTKYKHRKQSAHKKKIYLHFKKGVRDATTLLYEL